MSYPRLIENLIENLTQLPGVGRRSAERMVFWFLNHSHEESNGLANSIMQLKEKLRFCRVCNNLTENELCQVCDDSRRDHATICVVEDPKDLLAIERSGAYKGAYHVLLGSISPAEGRGPDNLKIQQLLTRVREGGVKEIILATDPDNDGEMTALYLTKLLKPLGVKVSRIGLGLPMGSAVEFADMSTLSMSMVSRREIQE